MHAHLNTFEGCLPTGLQLCDDGWIMAVALCGMVYRHTQRFRHIDGKGVVVNAVVGRINVTIVDTRNFVGHVKTHLYFFLSCLYQLVPFRLTKYVLRINGPYLISYFDTGDFCLASQDQECDGQSARNFPDRHA